MLVSIPHSGSRAVAQKLGLRHDDTFFVQFHNGGIERAREVFKRYKVTVAFRDPLLALMSHKQRLDDKPARVLGAFKDLLTLISEFDPARIHVDLRDDIPVVGSIGDYPLKTAYAKRDMDFVKRELPEVDGLKPLRRQIEQFGYSGLPWFD